MFAMIELFFGIGRFSSELEDLYNIETVMISQGR